MPGEEMGPLSDGELRQLRGDTGDRPERKTLSTGLHLLDTRLNGGIRSGSVVALTADPLSMPEVFLYKFCESRRTFYFTTERKAEYVSEDIESFNMEPVDLKFVDIYSHHYLDDRGELKTGGGYEDRKTLDFVLDRLKKLRVDEGGINIVFDTFSFFEELEVSRKQIHSLLNYVYETSRDLNGLTYLLNTSKTGWFGQMLDNSCDVGMSASVSKSDESMEKVLHVPKLRGGTPPDESIKYVVESNSGIRVKTGRLV